MLIVIWLAFWAYFEFKIIRVFMWKRFGKEKLWIKNGNHICINKTLTAKEKLKSLMLNLVSDIELIALTKGSIADTFSQTFWVKGGERIEFTCQAKIVKFGMQLDDDEANKIIAALKKFLKSK
jgi:hypothetical protein